MTGEHPSPRFRARLISRAQRIGAGLVAPGSLLGDMNPKEAESDGAWMGLLFVLGSRSTNLAEGIAALNAMRNFSGILSMVSELAWAMIPLIALGIAMETVLGKTLRHLRGTMMGPFVLLATLVHGSMHLGWHWPKTLAPGIVPTHAVPEFLAACICLARALWLRRRVAAEINPRRKLGRVVTSLAAVGLIVLVVLGLMVDIRVTAQRWDRMGPLGPAQRLPDFDVQELGGAGLRSDELTGGVTVLAFWATWCGVCHTQLPILESVAGHYSTEKVRIYGVNTDDGSGQESRVVRYLREKSVNLAMLLDSGSMARDFRVSKIPHIVIVDHHGEIRHVHQGRVRESVLVAEIDALREAMP